MLLLITVYKQSAILFRPQFAGEFMISKMPLSFRECYRKLKPVCFCWLISQISEIATGLLQGIDMSAYLSYTAQNDIRDKQRHILFLHGTKNDILLYGLYHKYRTSIWGYSRP